VHRLRCDDAELARGQLLWIGCCAQLGEDFAVPTEKTPDAVLEGTASGVFLALWGRVPLSSLTISGSSEGAETLVAALRTG